MEALPGVLWNRAFISEEQGNKGQILRETKNNTVLENREHKKLIFDFWPTGNKPNYFRGTREKVPPPGRASTCVCDTIHILAR